MSIPHGLVHHSWQMLIALPLLEPALSRALPFSGYKMMTRYSLRKSMASKRLCQLIANRICIFIFW